MSRDLLLFYMADGRHAAIAELDDAPELRHADLRADGDQRRRGGRAGAVFAVTHRARLFVSLATALHGRRIRRPESPRTAGHVAIPLQLQLVERREVLVQ